MKDLGQGLQEGRVGREEFGLGPHSLLMVEHNHDGSGELVSNFLVVGKGLAPLLEQVMSHLMKHREESGVRGLGGAL